MTDQATIVVARLEDHTPTKLPVLMVDCDRCDKPCWIEGGTNDRELMDMLHVCQPCMRELMDADPSIEEGFIGNYTAKTRTMPIDPHYADQATTAAAALLKAYRSKDSN